MNQLIKERSCLFLTVLTLREITETRKFGKFRLKASFNFQCLNGYKYKVSLKFFTGLWEGRISSLEFPNSSAEKVGVRFIELRSPSSPI